MPTNLEVFRDDLALKWNPERFGIPREPALVGVLENRAAFAKPMLSVLDMPIKLPGGDIKNPSDNPAVAEMIEKSIAFEETANPNWRNYHMYLTVDQRLVTKGFSQRIRGAHFDGMQGTKFKEKLPVCHQYLVADTFPTEFYTQPFDTRGLDEKQHNWFVELSKQSDQSNKFVANPYGIYFMDAYMLHDSPIVTSDTMRTFCRVEFSLKPFNREENSRNPLLPTGWKYEHQPIPTHLQVAPLQDTGWDNK